MLQPKRTKYRKAFKGRIHGKAKGGTELNFGAYGLKALTPGRLSARQTEAARPALPRHMKRVGKLWSSQIGRAPMRQRGRRDVSISVGGVYFKKTKQTQPN